MEDKLFKIINHYGIENQQRKLAEEVFELQEAITCHDLNNSVSYEIPLCELAYGIDHITEELADVMVVLYQFKELYHIDDKDIMNIMNKKIDRTIKRMEDKKD